MKKRLIHSNYKTASDYNVENFSNYDFLGSLYAPSKENVRRREISSADIVQEFKSWYVQNWVDQGKDIQELKYVALIPESIFQAWTYAFSHQYIFYDHELDQAKFLLKSERILR